jgi:hypothetical protein
MAQRTEWVSGSCAAAAGWRAPQIRVQFFVLPARLGSGPLLA